MTTTPVLVVMPPSSWKNTLQAEVALTLSEAQEKLKVSTFACVVLFDPQLSFLKQERASLHNYNLSSNLIYISNGDANSSWPLGPTPFRFLKPHQLSRLPNLIEEAIEHHQKIQQEQDHLRLLQEQNEHLRHQQKNLQKKLERQKKSLSRSQELLKHTHFQNQILNSIYLIEHQAQTLPELTDNILKVLKAYFPIVSCHLPSSLQNFLPLTTDHHVHFEPLILDHVSVGHLILVFDNKMTASHKENLKLWTQIAAVIAPTVDRLDKFAQAELIHQQWQSTFDSISEPLCLTDHQFHILRVNQAFAKSTNTDVRELSGKACFQLFFDPMTAEEISHLGYNFKVQKNRTEKNLVKTYEIKSQSLHFQSLHEKVILVLFHDLTARLQLEKKIAESSKMAELGLIGSSIAHELNNPLSGILTFIQLLKMDPKQDPLFLSDLLEMEKAATRCGEIISRLLGFARRRDLDP